MKNKIIKPILIFLTAAAMLLALYYFIAKPLLAYFNQDDVSAEDIARAERGDIEVKVTAVGKVAPKESWTVTSKPSGILQQVFVREGDSVKKGQHLAIIKPGRNEFEDYKPMPIAAPGAGLVLRCPGSTSGRQDEAVTVIPNKGTFLTGTYDSAENAKCFIVIADISSFTVPVFFSEMQILKINKKQKAKVKISALNEQEFDAEIKDIAPQAQEKGFLVVVEFPSDGRSIPLGANANVSILTASKKDVLKIPATALFEKDGEYFVFKYKNKTAPEQAKIKTGFQNDAEAEVVEGLSEGDEVLTVLPYGQTW